ncbi:MAG TPA: hypothetical protein VGU61_19785 [Noviherbaspirillum sp.]|jgi:hypothetical protein|uniref:hypothetical protein n=1 Tax=Noviherbaspirillum sp. TaxID=1926288 RepID=UPI002DDCB369|nr:hypothetical protein [Noviherbaspirillum sp.]HEV2612513.1 hypothetical protein [Noviherbaspirillum sp.]
MKRMICLAALLAFSMSGHASGNAESLVKACQSLKRQSDRNKCLEEAIKSSANAQPAVQAIPAAPAVPEAPVKEIAAKRAETIFASVAAMKSVIDIGVSYNDYQPYIQRIAVDLGQYRQAAQLPEEKDAVALLEKALEAYGDARDYWQADINFYSRRDNRLAYAGGLPTTMAGVGGIVSKYDIPVQKSDIWGINHGATRGVALSRIWSVADESVTAAKALLDGIGQTKDSAKPGAGL